MQTHPVGLHWRAPAPALSGTAALGAQWQREAQQNSLLHSPPAPYSTFPSSASAQPPPPGDTAPPHAEALCIIKMDDMDRSPIFFTQV